MRFSTALVSIFSLSLISGALAAPVHESSSLSARDASFEVSSIETRDEEYDFGDVLEARGKAPKISFALQKGKLNSKDRQLAEEQAEDACAAKGYKAGTVIFAYHLSNGESIEHITIEVADGKKIHAYRDGIVTQGEERRPASRSPSPVPAKTPTKAPVKAPKKTKGGKREVEA